MSYNQHKLCKNNQKMMDCEWPLGMIHFSLILHHNVGMKYAKEPFNMGMFFNLRRPSKWVHFQTPNKHIWAFLYLSRPPGMHQVEQDCTCRYNYTSTVYPCLYLASSSLGPQMGGTHVSCQILAILMSCTTILII